MSLHADALATLAAWAPPSPAQSALRARYVDHLRAHPDAMTRACYPAHLTVGAIVLSASLDRVLLNLHRKANRWFHFGGHCEPADDTLRGVAVREALEESGLTSLDLAPDPVQLSEHPVPFCDPRGVVQHLDVRYAASVPDGVQPVASDESLAVRWWPLDRLPELEPEMHDLIAAARQRLG